MPPESEIVKLSVVPGSPLSWTVTVKVQGAPLLVQVPLNVAVLPATTSEAMVTLCTVAPVAWFTYCNSPRISPVACCCTMKPKVPIPPATSIEPPPLSLCANGGGGSTTSPIFATNAS